MRFFKSPRLSAIFTSVFLFHSTLFAAGINPANKLKIGDKTASDKVIEFDKGSGTTNPKIKWSNSSSKLQFTHDGTNFKDIGSGAGGGGGINLLTDDNFDFEAGTTNWTVSGGTLTSETGSPLFGAASGSFDASASSQNLDSTTKTIPVGLLGTNCLAQVAFRYPSGSSGDYKLQALDGSSNVLAELSIPLTVGSGAENAYVVFSCPTSGSLKLRITSTANGSALLIDNAHLGSNTRAVQIAQAAFAGSSYFATTTNCFWSRTNTALGAFSTDPDCPGPTIDTQKIGTWSTTDSDLPRQTINLPPGLYRVTVNFNARVTSAGADVSLALSDGTDTRGRVTYIDSGGAVHFPVSMSAWFEYSSAGSRTFELFGASSAGDVQINLEANNRRVSFHIERYPLMAEQSISFDKADWLVDVNVGGANPSIGTAAASTYTEITDAGLDMVVNSAKGSAGAEIPCSATNASTGLTCSAGNESLGVAFTPPWAGLYQVCADFIHRANGINDITVFQLVETPNNAQTILQEGGGRTGGNTSSGDSSFGRQLCGTFYFSSTSKRTVRLMYEQAVTAGTSNTILADRSASSGQRDIKFVVKPVNYTKQGVTFSNMVSSPSDTVEKIARVRVASSCTGSPCTITSQSGAWVSSITRAGVGDYALNMAASTFSATPTCTITAVYGQNDYAHCSWREGGTQSATVRTFDCGDAGDVARDTGFEIMCMGPK